MRSDSSEKRTASPSNATLSWDSDTSVIFSGMNIVAAAMPELKRRETPEWEPVQQYGAAIALGLKPESCRFNAQPGTMAEVSLSSAPNPSLLPRHRLAVGCLTNAELG